MVTWAVFRGSDLWEMWLNDYVQVKFNGKSLTGYGGSMSKNYFFNDEPEKVTMAIDALVECQLVPEIARLLEPQATEASTGHQVTTANTFVFKRAAYWAYQIFTNGSMVEEGDGYHTEKLAQEVANENVKRYQKQVTNSTLTVDDLLAMNAELRKQLEGSAAKPAISELYAAIEADLEAVIFGNTGDLTAAGVANAAYAKLVELRAAHEREVAALRDALTEIRDYDVKYHFGFVDEWNEASGFTAVCKIAGAALENKP